MLSAWIQAMATSSSAENSSSAPGTPLPHQETTVNRQPIATAAGDLVKCRENGEMDWHTLGNVITAKVLEESLCISYADFKYGRMTRGSNIDVDWKFAYEDKGLMVFTKPVSRSDSSNVLCFASRGVLKFPVKEIAAVLCDPNDWVKWDKLLIENKPLQVISDTENEKSMIAYSLRESRKCLFRVRRDVLGFVHGSFRDDESFVFSGVSIDHPAYPAIKGITRCTVGLGSGWVLEPFEGNPLKTLATYMINIDLCSPLPTRILAHVMHSQPLAIYYLKKYLKSLSSIPSEVSIYSNQRKSIIEPELETSLTTTVRTESFLAVNCRSSTLYREQMGVDHFMGNKGMPIEEDECSALKRASRCSSQARSSGVWSQETDD